MPCAVDQSVITIDSSTAVAIDTINHEGILEDRGAIPTSYSPLMANRSGDPRSEP